MNKKKERQECNICQNPSEYQITTCNHAICERCLKNYCQAQSQQKKALTQISCPVVKCKGKVIISELMKILTIPNSCRRCKTEQAYTCGPCILKDIEDIAKVNFYSKQLKFEQLINIEKQRNLNDFVHKNDLNCTVCREFNQNPIIICAAGHEICRECFYNIKGVPDANLVCPICKGELLKQPPNSLRAIKLIQSLEIQCPTCSKPVSYQDFITNHFRRCCEAKIQCVECLEFVEVQFYDIHAANYCSQSSCPFVCDRKLVDHQNNFITDHLLTAMRSSDVAHTFVHRMQVVEKYLFQGLFGLCTYCDGQYAWQMDIRGVQETFCFRCFRLV